MSPEQLTWHDVKSNLDRQKQLLKSIVPIAPDVESRNKIIARVEAACIKLFRAFILSSNREEIIGDALAEIEEKVKLPTTSDQEVIKLVEQMKKVAEAAEEKYLATLTDDFVKQDERYKKHKREVDVICREAAGGQASPTSSTATEHCDTQDVDDEDPLSYIPTIDPLTKGPLLDPIKNKFCNHFYGQASVKAMLGHTRKAKCPYGGCSNTKFLRMSDLVFDQEMANKIAAKLNAADGNNGGGGGQRQKKRRNRSAVLVEDEED